MKILLTGANGYIGKRLLPTLLDEGHTVVCCVRDAKRFKIPEFYKKQVEVIEIDLLKQDTLIRIPDNIDAAYYLVHSMSTSKNYQKLEQFSAQNFNEAVAKKNIKQTIYLSGIVNEDNLSDHLISRKNVELELSKGNYALTTLRAGIIIGSGSASFEIVRDLVEKLPLMIAPKWLNTKSQPIAIRDVISYLKGCLLNEQTYDKSFDIGGPDVLTYKQMLQGFAKVRGLKRIFIIVPVMTPKLSSYWLYFVTSVSYNLARSLVDSMKVEVVCRNNDIQNIIPIKPISYEEALEKAFAKIENQDIISSWKDSFTSGKFNINISDFIHVPTNGCFVDRRIRKIKNKQQTIEKVWRIGGDNGWYFLTFLWKIRGFIDRLYGGVGLRRGRTHEDKIDVGDAVDFWRVIYANKDEGRLLLFAEMKVPGEAWLEFRVLKNMLVQTATFRPKGLRGRLYWYSVLPFHGIIFTGMINKLTKK